MFNPTPCLAHSRGRVADDAPNGWPSWVLCGFRVGDRRALGEVYRLHAPDVARRLRHGFSFEASGAVHRFVGYGSGFELQDALHETFRRAFEPRARDSYDGIRPYGPYLQAIARNVVLRGFRAQRVRFPLQGESAAPLDAIAADEGTTSPERAIGRHQVQEIVQRFLADLSQGDRRLVDARFIEGMSQRDAADALGLGRQQVRSREAKIRSRLLAFLRRHAEGGDPAAWNVLAMLLAEVLLVSELLREGVGR